MCMLCMYMHSSERCIHVLQPSITIKLQYAHHHIATRREGSLFLDLACSAAPRLLHIISGWHPDYNLQTYRAVISLMIRLMIRLMTALYVCES